MKKTKTQTKRTAGTRRGKKEQDHGHFADLGQELITLIGRARDKYENLDDRKKKAVIAGAAGAIALIAGAVGHRRRKK